MLPISAPGAFPSGYYPVRNGWPRSSRAVAPRSIATFSGNGSPQDSYPNYTATAPLYAQPPPPLNTMVPPAPEGIAEPPSSVRISDKHAIGRTTEGATPPRRSIPARSILPLSNSRTALSTPPRVLGEWQDLSLHHHAIRPLPGAIGTAGDLSPRRPSQASDAMLTAAPK